MLPCRPRLRGLQRDKAVCSQWASSSEEEDAPAQSTLSSSSLLSLPSFKDVGSEKGGEKEVWLSVFMYLSRAELLACMTVCKAWYKWYVLYSHTRIDSKNSTSSNMSFFAVFCRTCDKRLWNHIDVSRCSPLSNQALAGIVKRQPTSLDLSWTPMARRQLNCLLTRLPGMTIAGCTCSLLPCTSSRGSCVHQVCES